MASQLKLTNGQIVTIEPAAQTSGAATLSIPDLAGVAKNISALTTAEVAVLATLLGASANGKSLVTAADYSAMRTLLGLVIGTNVQAYDADLTTWAGLTPSANAQSLVTAADYSAMRTLLGLLIKRKAATTTRASTSYVADADFDVTLGASETWQLHYRLFFTESNGAGPKAQLTFPATATVVNGSGIISDDAHFSPLLCSIAYDATQPCPLFARADEGYHTVDYIITMTTAGGGGGTVRLEWGCDAVFDVSLLGNSTVTATRIF